MLGDADLVAFAAAADLAESRGFYEGVLGLRLLSDESPMACVFDAHGTVLRVTAVPEVAVGGYTVLGWDVADIAPSVRALRERGVELLRFDGMDQDDLGVWTAPGGAKVAWFRDPAGNTLSLTERPTS